MSLTIHENIHNKLYFFIKENKIPHIIFYGPSGSGKRTILNGFINDIYNSDKQKIKRFNLISSWIVRQFQNEYNPIHFHDGDISGVGYLKIPKNLTKNKKKIFQLEHVLFL